MESKGFTITEIRCPACVSLNYPSSKLLVIINGKMIPVPSMLQEFKCPRCKSVVGWYTGTPLLFALKLGVKCHKRQTVAFE